MNTATRAFSARALPGRAAAPQITGVQWSISALIVALLLSAFSIVYTKDLNRRLFIQSQSFQQEKTQAEVQWRKLMLEESTWSAQSRIQQIAQQKLNMRAPGAQDIILVRDPVESDA